MFAIAVLGIGAAYVAVSMLVIWMTVSVTRKRGRRGWLWGLVAALVMFLIPFWDWLPTVYAHKYYCEKEAGFWVYKTLEQWKVENPGVMEGLVADKDARLTRNGDDTNFTDTYFLNQRINKVVREYRVSSVLHVFRHEQDVVDTKNNQVLARYVDFRAGYLNGIAGSTPRSAGIAALKFWLVNKNCGSESNYGGFLLIKRTFQGVGK